MAHRPRSAFGVLGGCFSHRWQASRDVEQWKREQTADDEQWRRDHAAERQRSASAALGRTKRLLEFFEPEVYASRYPDVAEEMGDIRDRWLATADDVYAVSVVNPDLSAKLNDLVEAASNMYANTFGAARTQDYGNVTVAIEERDRAKALVEEITALLDPKP